MLSPIKIFRVAVGSPVKTRPSISPVSKNSSGTVRYILQYTQHYQEIFFARITKSLLIGHVVGKFLYYFPRKVRQVVDTQKNHDDGYLSLVIGNALFATIANAH